MLRVSSKQTPSTTCRELNQFCFSSDRQDMTMLLCRHSAGTYQERAQTQLIKNIQPQSSQLTEPLWTDPGPKSGISVRKRISTLKKKKKKRHGWEMNGQTFSQNHCKRGKSQHHLHHLCIPSPVSTCRDMLKVSSLQTPSATCRERNQFCFSSDRQDMTPSLGTTHHYVCS